MPRRSLASILTALCVLCAGLALSRRASAFCFDEAAVRYRVPAELLETIAELESGLDPEAVHWNQDGSLDVGLMQVNSGWESKLGPKRWQAVCTDPCYNVLTGAWILADCLQRYGYTLEGIGCYNAVNPQKRERYTERIFRSLYERWLRLGPE